MTRRRLIDDPGVYLYCFARRGAARGLTAAGVHLVNDYATKGGLIPEAIAYRPAGGGAGAALTGLGSYELGAGEDLSVDEIAAELDGMGQGEEMFEGVGQSDYEGLGQDEGEFSLLAGVGQDEDVFSVE